MALSKPNPRNGWNAELALQHGWKVDDLLAASKNRGFILYVYFYTYCMLRFAFYTIFHY
jgi:hypothetical protein